MAHTVFGFGTGHWAEASFNVAWNSELMTPTFETFKSQPISRVTVGALDDLGVCGSVKSNL